ncbi:hypothetical protein MANES_01G259701v8 [Manihot esculenta]|uniref:Uncharacterized protein n=1 Tax=Manihot esculenta TaxID=3983 RepID=A0ACB7IH63_MANES|nr:hypothetical protein MANES_01G259701v8 [Manihot esculenta]
MATLSLVAGNCGRGKGSEDGFSFELGSNAYYSKALFASSFLRTVRGYRTGTGSRCRVIAKVKKGKKHDYPWPDDIDPNINQKVPEEVKAKMEFLKNAEAKLSKGEPLDKELVEEAEKAKKELLEVLKSSGLEIVGVAKRNVATPPPALREKIEIVNKEIPEEIERSVNAAGLSNKVEELKSEITKGSSSRNVEKIEAEIKEQILSALDAMKLKEKFENLRVELASSSETYKDYVGAEDGSL